MKVVAYVRVSTEEQNPESQKAYLLEWASRHGIEIVAFYEDVGISGYETHPFQRQGFKRAYEHAKRERLPILTISLDRISRRYKTLIEVLNKLREEGVQVISIQEQWLSTLMQIQDPLLREFIFNIIVGALGYAYEMYIQSLREKIKAGLTRVRKEGKHIGRVSVMHNPKKQELFKIVVCMQKTPYRKAAELLGLTKSQVEYWAKKLCNW